MTGLTGIKIIDAIFSGDLSPESLAKYRHYNCRKSEEEISKALISNERKDCLFGLKREYQRYKFCKKLIDQCDIEISEFLQKFIEDKPDIVDDLPSKKPYKRQNKNGIIGVDLNVVAYQYFDGVDLLAIPKLSHSTVLTHE